MTRSLVAALGLAMTPMLLASVPWGISRPPEAAPILSDGVSPDGPPRAPCGSGDPYPNYPVVDAAPKVVLWNSNDLGEHWSPPPCVEWANSAASKVVGLAGRFSESRNANVMLAHIGIISSLRDIRYWSVTDKRWNALFVRVSALDGPDASKSRGDFSLDEIRAARDLYFLAADNRSGEDTVWRLHIREIGERRIIVETANVTPLRWLFLPLISAGNMQTSYFLEREPDATWRLYSLTRVQYVLPLFAFLGSDDSYTNRALAFYQHFVGIPDEIDGPR